MNNVRRVFDFVEKYFLSRFESFDCLLRKYDLRFVVYFSVAVVILLDVVVYFILPVVFFLFDFLLRFVFPCF